LETSAWEISRDLALETSTWGSLLTDGTGQVSVSVLMRLFARA
jgi:hypothetical protein